MAQTPDINTEAERIMGEDEGGGDDFAVIPRASASVELGGLGGDTDASNMRLPRLQTVYGVGKLIENFNPGDFVLNGDSRLVSKGEPLLIVILSAMEYWKEYLTQEMHKAGVKPRVFLTEKEVLDAGETTEWVNLPEKKAPTFSRALDMKILIRKPKDLICGLFGMEFEGETYAPALWSVDKTAYKRIGPTVNMSARLSLSGRKVDGVPTGLLGGVFEIKNVINRESKVEPAIRMAAHSTPEFVRYIRSLFGVAPVAADPATGEAG